MSKKNTTIFSKKIFFSMVFLSLIILALSVSSAQIAYDDSTRETDLIVSNNAYAVKITPERTGELTSIDAYLKRSGGNYFDGLVWAYAMNSIHVSKSANLVSVPNTGTYSWKNYSAIPNFENSSDFYVGIGKLMPSTAITLGSDTDSPSGRSENSNSMFDPSSYVTDNSNNYMIRANFHYYPTVSNIAITPNPTNTNPLVTATCTAYDSTVKKAHYSIDNDAWTAMNPTDGTWDNATEEINAIIPTGALADGSHNIEIRCRDNDNYFTKPLASTTFFIDTVNPNTTISFVPPTPNGNGWYKSPVIFNLSATDAEPSSGIAYSEYMLFGATSQTWTKETTKTISNNGTTRIIYRSADNAGNIESIAGHVSQISIDQTAPSTPILNPFPNDYINGTSQTVSWTASTDLPSGIDYYNIYREINETGTFALLASTTNTWHIDNALANNNKYNYYITAVDNAGNESTASNQDWFAVDMSSPSDPFMAALPTYTDNAGTVDLAWTASNDQNMFPSGINSYELNENAATTNVGNTIAYSDAGNPDATTHSYKTRALDNSVGPNYSNWSNTETTIIDITMPVTTASLFPALPDGDNNWHVNPVMVTLTANDSGSGIAHTYYCIDSTNTCPPNIEYFAAPFVVSTEGINYARYYSVDNVGNTEATNSTGAFYIDLTNPYNQIILLDGDANYNTDGTVDATMNIGNDNISGLSYCKLSWDNGATLWENIGLAASAGPHAYADGTQIAQYKCFDNAGNESAIVQDYIIVDTNPPVSAITRPDNSELVLKGKIFLEGTAFDAVSGVKKVQIMVKDSNDNVVLNWADANGTDNWSYYWNASALTDGSYLIKSRAEDNAGLQEADANILITTMANPSPYMENVYYENAGNKHVFVYGFLDLANWNYTIEIFDALQGLSSPAIYAYPVTTDNNAFFGQGLDASSWDLNKLYTARVTPYNGNTIYTQFDALYYSYQIDLLDQRLQAADANIAALWQDSNNQQQQINDLNMEIQNIYNELDTINQQLSDLNSDVTYLLDKVQQLQNQIDFLFNVLKVMNHATINMFYNSPIQKLNVWGAAAHGTLGSVGLILIPVDTNSPSYFYTTTVSGPNNAYQFTMGNGNPIDTSVLEKKSYNVFVYMLSNFRPPGAPPMYVVGTIFDNLAIEELNAELAALENTVDMLNTGNIQFQHNSTSNNMTILGEAPTTAQCAKTWIYTASGTFLAHAHIGVSENPTGADYSLTDNTTGWPQETLNIIVQFYNNTGCHGSPIGTVQDTFDSLLSEDLFGFRDITASTYVTSYYVNNIQVPVTFALKSDYGSWFGGMLYKIEYRTNPGEGWNELEGCSYYPEGIKTYKHGNIELNSTGTKRVQLRAVRCGPMPHTEDYTSYTFRIRHVDLKDALEAYTTIVSPLENSHYDEINYSYPVGSIEPNVYWTQSGNLPLLAYFTTNTEPANPRCGVFYDDEYGVERTIGNYLKTAEGPDSWYCDIGAYNFNTDEWGNTNRFEGKYTTIRVSERVVSQADAIDEIHMGIDNQKPEINSITPDESEIMNGIYTWHADVSDNLSGIAQVDFYLIEKAGYEYCKQVDENLQCWIGDGNSIWPVPNVSFNANIEPYGKFYYDLNTLNFPDGDYNVGFGATDIAGNYFYKEVDPIIDNTKPIINSVAITPAGPKIRGTTIIISANVSDNLSGVNSVWATITRQGGAIDSLPLAGTEPNYTANYVTDTSFPADGTYNVQINAVDNATNNAVSYLASFDLNYSYAIDINLSSNSATQGDSVTITGKLTKDDSTIIGDYTIELALPTGTVTIDVNAITGEFSYVLNTAGIATGTHTITGKATAPNSIVSTSTEQLTINALPVPTPTPPATGGSFGGGGSSGGSSGSSLILTIDGNCLNKEIIITVRNPANNLVPGATIAVMKNNSQIAELTSDSSGKAVFIAKEAGKYTFNARKGIASSTIYSLEIAECTEPVETPQAQPETEKPKPSPAPAPNTTGKQGIDTSPAPTTMAVITPTGFFGLESGIGNIAMGILVIIGVAWFGFAYKAGLGKQGKK
jgi:hypothetical protein